MSPRSGQRLLFGPIPRCEESRGPSLQCFRTAVQIELEGEIRDLRMVVCEVRPIAVALEETAWSVPQEAESFVQPKKLNRLLLLWDLLIQ